MKEELNSQEKIDAQLATALSTESAIEWLKSNAKNSTADEGSGSPSYRLKEIINISFADRDEPNLNLALARYGTHIETLKKLFQSNDRLIKIAILANPLVGPIGRLDPGIIERNEAVEIIENPSVNNDFIKALFSNPGINTEFVSEIIKKEKEFRDIKDFTLQEILLALISNPVLSKSRKFPDRYSDGWDRFISGQLPNAVINLVSSVEVNKLWATLLQRLIEKIDNAHSGDIEPVVLDRWWDEERNEDEEVVEDRFFYLRKEIAQVLLRNRTRQSPHHSLSPHHKDKAVRLAYYACAKPEEMFGNGIWLMDFSYLSFSYENDPIETEDNNDLSETKQRAFSICEKFLEQDKEDFVETLRHNLFFWKRLQERDLLLDLSTHLGDKTYEISQRTFYFDKKDYLMQEYPDFFKDEYFEQNPEKIELNNKFEKINLQLRAIDEQLKKLTSE